MISRAITAPLTLIVFGFGSVLATEQSMAYSAG
jgi:hypothetical protein